MGVYSLIVRPPTHMEKMSDPLKILIDHKVPVFMGEKPNGFPIPSQKRKPTAIDTVCAAPWSFNFMPGL
jgi:hypothetical protein